MKTPLPGDWKELLTLFEERKVEYVVVGAMALAIHGFPRYSGDLDLFVRAAPENAVRIVQALAEFGFGLLGLTAEDFCQENIVIQLGVAPHRVDLMTSIDGVHFEEAWEGHVRAKLDGLELSFIGRSELLKNKLASGRTKDLADAENLRRGRPDR